MAPRLIKSGPWHRDGCQGLDLKNKSGPWHRDGCQGPDLFWEKCQGPDLFFFALFFRFGLPGQVWSVATGRVPRTRLKKISLVLGTGTDAKDRTYFVPRTRLKTSPVLGIGPGTSPVLGTYHGSQATEAEPLSGEVSPGAQSVAQANGFAGPCVAFPSSATQR